MLSQATRFAADLIFPPQCALCGDGGTLLCESCAQTLPRAVGERCVRCWIPVRGATLCAHCIADPPAFLSLRAAYVLDGGARRLAHELKYEGLTSLAEPMARLAVSVIDGVDAELIVPVPLYAARERSRGYNQAAEIARHIARIAALPYDGRALRRVRKTEPLAKTMHREERRAIVAGAFEARRDRVDGRAVLLADDVVTTGATLDAAARALIEAGATAVRCVTWARAD